MWFWTEQSRHTRSNMRITRARVADELAVLQLLPFRPPRSRRLLSALPILWLLMSKVMCLVSLFVCVSPAVNFSAVRENTPYRHDCVHG